MEETTDALGLMEGREEEWREARKRGRKEHSTKKRWEEEGKREGRGREGGREVRNESAYHTCLPHFQDYRDLPSFNHGKYLLIFS